MNLRLALDRRRRKGRAIARGIIHQPELACRILIVHELTKIRKVGTLAGGMRIPEQFAVLLRRLAERELLLAVDLHVQFVELLRTRLELSDDLVGIALLLWVKTEVGC